MRAERCRVKGSLYRFIEVPIVGTPGAGNMVLEPAFARPIFPVLAGGQVAGSFPCGGPTLLFGFQPSPFVMEGLQYSASENQPLVDSENRYAPETAIFQG